MATPKGNTRSTSAADTRIRTPLLSDKQAAALLGRSVGSLRNIRTRDRKRLASGEQIHGPRWVIIHGAPRYELPEVLEWIEANAVVLGEPRLQPQLRAGAAKMYAKKVAARKAREAQS